MNLDDRVAVRTDIRRRLFAEYLGSAFLAALVIGSGIAAQQLSPHDTGLARPSASPRTTARRASHLLAEVVATLGLLLVIFSLARSGRISTAPAAVGAYIGAAYWFTSSTSFANPAITVGRVFSNTFAAASRRHRFPASSSPSWSAAARRSWPSGRCIRTWGPKSPPTL
jgi:glycerol uptake facilitator-like aquaporin